MNPGEVWHLLNSPTTRLVLLVLDVNELGVETLLLGSDDPYYADLSGQTCLYPWDNIDNHTGWNWRHELMAHVGEYAERRDRK